jgi:hypothetical protein
MNLAAIDPSAGVSMPGIRRLTELKIFGPFIRIAGLDRPLPGMSDNPAD